MKTVQNLFVTLLSSRLPSGHVWTRGRLEAEWDSLDQMPLASHCGETCRLAITETAKLLAVLQQHYLIENALLEACLLHCSIICNG